MHHLPMASLQMFIVHNMEKRVWNCLYSTALASYIHNPSYNTLLSLWVSSLNQTPYIIHIDRHSLGQSLFSFILITHQRDCWKRNRASCWILACRLLQQQWFPAACLYSVVLVLVAWQPIIATKHNYMYCFPSGK